jgi:hypothetical protein
VVVVQHVLFGLSLACLAGAGLRLASLTGAGDLTRALAAAALAASAACLSALLLGLAGLGTSPIALTLAAAALWLAARLRLPEPTPPPRHELARAWTATPLGGRLLLGALAGAWLAWTAWLLRYPALGIDSVAYHLTEIVGWIHDGRPGAVEPIVPGLPVGNYPLTNEVILAWGMGISRSFVWASVWTPAALVLLAAAGWSGLRSLRAARLPAGLAVAAVVAIPVLTAYQQNGAYTDLPALAWLVTAAALAAQARRHPALLAPVLLAAALAAGTKTTALPLALLLVALAAYEARAHLRALAAPLALAAAAAVAVGGYWYLRNLVDHGSPFWPFVSTPWSDPPPGGVPGENLDVSLLDRPRLTIDEVGDDWLRLIAGPLAMVVLALAAPLAARRRAVTLAAAVTAGSALIWMNAPFTGYSVRGFEVATISTVRYALPAFAAAAVTLALAATSPRRAARALGLGGLVLGLALGVVQTADLGFPSVPGPSTPLAGALAGAAAAALATYIAPRLPDAGRVAGRAAVPAAAVLLGLVMALASDGYVRRHADTARLFGTDMVRWFTDQPAFDDGRTITGVPILLAPLAGDRLQNRFEWIDRSGSCGWARPVERGWAVVLEGSAERIEPTSAARCLRGREPALEVPGFSVYPVRGG